jgi:hypothetical protein
MSPQTERTLTFKSLKLKLVNAYMKDGEEGIKQLINQSGQAEYLKRHRLFEPTVREAVLACENLIKR